MQTEKLSFDVQSALKRATGDSELLKELAELCAEDCQELVPEIRCAIDSGDAELIERHAHALNGSVASMCATQASMVAKEMEQLGKAGDVAEAKKKLATLEQAIETLLEDFSQIKSG